jgi:multidrug efflux pump subunit AcrA (membrane-fusion protein)
MSTNTSITAPISGFISEVYAREGEIAWPGKELFTIVDNSDLYIKVSIPKHIASLITINNSIAIAFKELESDVQGIVSEISKCDADGSEDYTITIELPKNKGLKVNMVGTIKTKLTERKTILIPKEFIFYTNEEPFVCTIKKGEFIKYKVKLGRAYDDLQEIYSDLLPGSTICRN